MKGLFIPDITAEMFRNGCLEGIEALMAEGDIYDIDYTEWNPVSDDSVVPDYEVMCQDRHGNMMLGYALVDEYGIWMCEDNGTIMDDVIAWRPLPEPYKGGDKE